MPTLNPRINVTLSPSLDSLVSTMARLERISKSQVLRELLEAAEPALQRAVALMEAALNVRANARAEVKRGIDKAQSAAEASLEEVLTLINANARDLVTEAQAIRGRRPARKGLARAPAASPSPERRNPPSSNRGVNSHKTLPKAGPRPSKKVVSS